LFAYLIHNYSIQWGTKNKTQKCGGDVAEWLERPTVNAVVATVLGSIPASSDTVEFEGAADATVLNTVHKKSL
jgi:hypothetical protein